MKVYGGTEVQLHHTSALDGDQWSASRTGCFNARETAPRYPLARRLGGSQSRSGRYGEEKHFFPLSGIEPRLTDLQPEKGGRYEKLQQIGYCAKRWKID
jgi:hypothetical protein